MDQRPPDARRVAAPLPTSDDFKRSVLIKGEAHLFLSRRPTSLLHPLEEVVAVYSYDTLGRIIRYEPGRDWIIRGGGLARVPSSRLVTTVIQPVPAARWAYSPDLVR